MATFAGVYRQYAPGIYRYALSLTGNPADAEDLVAETFLRAWATPTPLHLETVRSYLAAIVRNLFLEGARKSSRERVLDQDYADARDLAADQESRDVYVRLRELVAELPETTRSALLMHSVIGLTYTEISRVLGIPEGALRVRVCRARVELAAQLGRTEVCG